MASKKVTRHDVTFENSIDVSLGQDSSASPAKSSKVKQWRALRWALKFTGRASSDQSSTTRIEERRDYRPPEVPYYQCFKELIELTKLLSQLKSMSESLASALESEEISTATPLSKAAAALKSPDIEIIQLGGSSGLESADTAIQPESVKSYQEFLDMFMSLFLHSNFLSFLGGVSEETDPDRIISTLVGKSCPELSLFRRVCVCPKFVGSQFPDSHNENLFRDVPVNQLARFCDVAVLRFLSTTTEHTSRESVIWALEYLHNLLDSLHASLSKLYSYGWYGAPPLRTRKGTTMGRHSITYPPPMISPFSTPPVVVVGTPPTSPPHSVSTTPSPEPVTNASEISIPFLDPETGQRSPASPLSPLSPLSPPSPLSRSAAVAPPGRRVRATYPPISVESEPTLHGVGGAAAHPSGPRGRQRRISRDEHLGGILKRPSFEQPPRFHLTHTWNSSSPTSSPLHQSTSDSALPQVQHTSPSQQIHHTSPPRQLQNASPSRQIHHTSPPRQLQNASPSRQIHHTSPPRQLQNTSPSRQSMESIPEEGNTNVPHLQGSVGPSPNHRAGTGGQQVDVEPLTTTDESDHHGDSLAASNLARSPPPISSPVHLGAIQEVKEEVGGASFVNHLPERRSPSPGLSGIISSASSCSSLGDNEEVRSKPVASSTITPHPYDVPKVNVQMELDTLMNGEGRISLLAILHAVSKLPQTQELWLGNMGEKCFTIIQLCMDLGLRTSSAEDTLPKPAPSSSSSQEKRRQFQAQRNTAFHEHSSESEEKPSKTHSQYVVDFSVRALIHCATSLIVGCTCDPSLCKLRQDHLPDQSISTYNTLTRLLKRVYTFSPLCFRQALSDFAKPSGSTCRRLLQFLHVMLQYCSPPVDGHLNIFLMSIVSAVLRETIDRLVQLDITEASIQNSIVSEACSFFQFAQQLFNSESLATNKRFRHLHMYFHRIGLSVILPPRPRPQERKPLTTIDEISTEELATSKLPLREKQSPPLTEKNNVEDTPVKVTTLSNSKAGSKKLLKQATFALGFSTASSASAQDKSRPRSESLETFSPSSNSSTAAEGGKGVALSGKSRRAQITKQQSIHSDVTTSVVGMTEVGRRSNGTIAAGGTLSIVNGERMWRGLNLDLMRSRIQRLIVMMNMSEPGAVPEPGLLASLIDLGGESPVVSRAMVFLECALFVNNLVSDSATVWLEQNRDSPLLFNVSHNIRRWGEAIADKLKIVELKEHEILKRLTSEKGDESLSLCLPEEPVFPDEQDGGAVALDEESKSSKNAGEKLQTVSYAIKMAACILLLEITRFLRNTPDHFFPQVTSVSQVGTPRVSVTHIDRKPSSASVVSSDMEMGQGTSVLSHSPRLGHFGSSLSVEDAETSPYEYRPSPCTDEGGGSSSPRKKRASVYLRVTSTGGASGTISRSTSIRKHSRIVRVADSGGDHYVTQKSPSFRRQRKSAGFTAALHTSFYTGSRTRRPSIIPNATIGSYHPVPPKYRRKSMGAAVISREREVQEGDVTHSLHGAQPPPPAGGSKHSPSSFLGSSLGQKLRRSAQRAFRRANRSGSRQLYSDQTYSPGSSPGPGARKRVVSSRRPSLSGGSTTQSIGPHPLSTEESRKQFPWLDVIEHIVLADANNPDTRARHTQVCSALTTALNMVYSSTYSKDQSSEGEKERKSKQVNLKMSMSRSLSTLFTQRLSLADDSRAGSSVAPVRGRSSQQTARSVSLHSVRRRTLQRSSATLRQFSAASTVSTSISSSSLSPADTLARFSFSNLSYAQFTSSFLGATAPGGGEGGIEMFLEEESSFPRHYLLAELDKQRREYIKNEFLGLLHSPLSVLIHAAPILHDSTFSVLKTAVWDLLLDSDPELAKAAAVFFLLIGAKESDKVMEMFVREKVLTNNQQVHWEAVQKFKVLWDSRYHVWPRMEERAQKIFNVHNDSEEKGREDQQPIGYSLPANLIGNSGSAPPFPPWEPASVCTNKSCDFNPAKCYRHTRLAQIFHSDEITEKVQNFNVSGASMAQEASSKPASLYLGFESEEQDGIEYWEAVEPTLFPHSLFPLVRLVVMSLSPKHVKNPDHPSHSPRHHSDPSSMDVSELARQVVWTCMVEDPRLFFRTLLNQFNKIVLDMNSSSSRVDQLLAETLQPLHVLFQAFSFLPPLAAHNIFNNFVGIIMRHTDQPSINSHKIIQSVLTLITMVAPSVQGLDSKVLKSILKKESCYTTIMTTARIRGVERVYLISDHSQYGPQLYRVTDDMTFGHLISEVSRTKPPISEWYLVDVNKGADIPVLSSSVIQDEYSMPLDGHYPTFELCRVDNQSDGNLWNRQLEKLFVFKMSEAMRVYFMLQLLLTGPEVEQGFSYSEYAQPNYRFIHNELVQLNSFPRRALTSILYEAGPGALQRFQLKVSDVMLKTMWVQFVLQLFKSMKPDFDWSNNIVLFLNVINGALLLHSEDSAILKFCLATLMMAATKFSAIFKTDGYLMIVPTLIQVYALHIRNKLITEALKFAWVHFHHLDGYVFFLQVTAATATLVNEEAAFLSRSVASSFSSLSSGLAHMDDGEARKLLVRAVTELTSSLDIEPPSFPPLDELGIRSCCLDNLEDDLQSKLGSENWTKMTLLSAANLCISLARWDPEQLRGMQVLVFLDHLMPKFLEAFGTPSYYKSTLIAMEYLIKGCSAITKQPTWKGEVLTTRKNHGKGAESEAQREQPEGTPTHTGIQVHSDEETAPTGRSQPSRKTSMANAFHNLKLLVNPNKKDLSERMSFAEEGNYSRHRKLSAITPGATAPSLGKDFKSKKIQDIHQRIIRLSRDSLLSVATQFVMHFSSEAGRERRRLSTSSVGKQERMLDPPSISYLTSVAVQLLKQGSVNDEVLQMKGLNLFMTHLLPAVEWTEQYFASFNNILSRVIKLFKYLQRANRALTAWENLSGFLVGITQCVSKHPVLVQGQDQHLTKLKVLVDTLVSMHSGGGVGQQPLQKKWYRSIQRPLLASAPSYFSDAIVGLAVELIVATQYQQQSKFRYYAEDILRLMPHREQKTHEDQLLTKILLPLCIQLGLRSDLDQPSKGDADYMLKQVDNKVKFLLKIHVRGQKFPPEQFFRTFKVICLTFGETFTTQEWHKVAQWILSLTRTQLVSPTRPISKKISTTSIVSNESSGRSSRSSVSSGSGATFGNKLENYISFHESLLGFYESFVIVYRLPVFSLLWPLLRQLEPQLLSTLEAVKSDSPAHFERVNLCIERCQRLVKMGYGVSASKTKHQLLKELQEELKIVFQEEMSRSFSQLPQRHTLLRSNTSVEGGRPQRLSKRRLSTPYISPLTMIGEEDASLDLGSATLPRHLEQRPKTLQMRTRALTTGSALPSNRKSAGGTSPYSAKKASFADEIELKPVTKTKRSPSPRRSPRAHIASDNQTSPVRSKSPLRGRAPKLGVLGKLGSSGFYADNEDDDLLEIKVHPSKVTIQLPGETEDGLVVSNSGAVSAESSPLQVKRKSRNQVTIVAEVHESLDGEENTHPHLTTRVTFCDDQSTTPLLPSPEARRHRKGVRKVRGLSPLRRQDDSYTKTQEVSKTTDGDSDNLLTSGAGEQEADLQTSLSPRNNDNLTKRSLSLDRRNVAGIKELNSALKESSGYMYHSLEEAINDYSQC